MMPTVRAGASGKLLIPAPALGSASWDVAAPITLTLLQAGHMPGVYVYNIAIVVLAVATGGNITITLTWGQPAVGPSSLVISGGVTITASPGGFIAPRHFMSNGITAAQLLLTPVGVTGAPRVFIDTPIDVSPVARLASTYLS
jgi:hypothetical protein